MRPWMKTVAIGGVMAVALGVSLASDKPSDRRALAPQKKSSPGRLEFISRSGASSEQSDAPADPTADLVAEDLAAEVSAPPKQFSRSRSAAGEAQPSGTSKTTLLKPIKNTIGNAGTVSDLRQSSHSVRSPLKPVTEEVEFLSPPDSESIDAGPIKRKLISKKSSSVIQQAGFRDRSTTADETTNGESTDGIIAADFQQKPTEKSRIQPARDERDPVASATAKPAPAELPASTKPGRVSIINDHASKPTLAAASRITRPTKSSDHTPLSQSPIANGTSSVSVEWVKQGEISVGQECACDLLVKNSGKVAAQDVIVEAIFPASVRLTRAKPEPATVSDHLEWSIPVLAAGEERTIHITMIPSQRGDLATTAHVRFTGTAASVFNVAEPMLKVATDAPAEVIIGDPLVQTVTITNPGTGIAQNVKILVATPEGLEPTRGDRSQIEIGALNPGESRTLRLSFTAIAGGKQTLDVEASADSGLNQAVQATVNVIAPSLVLTVEGPSLHFAGREARFMVNVKNAGLAATDNVHVTHRIPKGFKFVKADKGGTLDTNTGAVNWTIGHLEPDQIVTLKLHLQATELGQFEHHVFASAEHGLTAKADTTTTIEGSAALAMEIHDLDDPAEVGQETAYEVRISNTGTKPAQNVGLTFELPRGVELLNVQSATQHLAKSGLILFNDLPELAPGKTALFRIHVRGITEGNQRVRARLTSDSIEQELITEELTKFYAE